MTLIRPKVMRLSADQLLPLGHYRSIPRSIDTPVPNGRVKPPRPEEQPVEIGTQDLQGQPFTEPENAPTLEPVSRL